MAGVSIVHVPYKGGAQAMTDMMSGQVHLIFESMSSISPHHRVGAAARHRRDGPEALAEFPRLPTIAESGVPGYDVTVWAGLITPVGVSKAVIATLERRGEQGDGFAQSPGKIRGKRRGPGAAARPKHSAH